MTTTAQLRTTAYRMWVDGSWAESESGLRYNRLSPGHGVEVGTYPQATAKDVDRAVQGARKSFDSGVWRETPAGHKSAVLALTASLIRKNAESLALIETLESGKPLKQARDEMQWAAGIWDYASALARHLHGQTSNHIGSGAMGLTLREPIGVVGLITPWNFPLLIISQKLPFALAAGCSCVVKPSELTSGTTLRLAELLKQAGLPDGVCQVVTGFGNPVGQSISEHPGLDMVSFTGSTGVGKAVVGASKGNLKKVALELGGKNPQIIFPDADLDAAAQAVVFGVYFNMGECCNSGSRILVHRDVPESFIERVIERATRVRVGDPLDESSQYGAIINEQQFNKIRDYVDKAKAKATVAAGGSALDLGRGHYFAPTVVTDVTPDQPIGREEVFGPVLSVLRFKDLDEAVSIANGTMYGLSAAVWSRDHLTLMDAARRIRAGTVWLNTFLDGTPELPFGGYGESGLGRELGPQAVEEYTEIKTVFMKLERFTSPWA
jgi:acyl-CoA reductase-like NAD-dependent aldehyde dehydrogenase